MPDETPSDPNLMAVIYAAVTAVEEGKVAEIEVDHRSTIGEVESGLTVTVRREVKPWTAAEA